MGFATIVPVDVEFLEIKFISIGKICQSYGSDIQLTIFSGSFGVSQIKQGDSVGSKDGGMVTLNHQSSVFIYSSSKRDVGLRLKVRYEGDHSALTTSLSEVSIDVQIVAQEAKSTGKVIA